MRGFTRCGGSELTEANKAFRRVLYTGKHLQLVLMALKPGEEIHADRDQFFRVEKGKEEVVIDDKRTRINGDDAMLVPAGARHNRDQHGRQALDALHPLRTTGAQVGDRTRVKSRG